MTGYGLSAAAYFEAGWEPLPLKHGTKWPPPKGFTGDDGASVSYADVHEWSEQMADGNIALRLPRGVIGIDVDGYKPRALETMNHHIATSGPLPATWRSSSRPDSVSGIYFYRVPEDVSSKLRDPRHPTEGSKGSDVEVIRWDHRYAVVAPSTHPEGGIYTWFDPFGGNLAPRVEQLPFLPDTWIAALRETEVVVPVGPSTATAATMSSYEQNAVNGMIARLQKMQADAVAPGQPYNGEPWDNTTAAVTMRLCEFANAEWSSITHEQVQQIVLEHAPRDGSFGTADHLRILGSARRKVGGKQAAPPRGAPVDADAGMFKPVAGAPATPTAALPASGWGRCSWDDFGNAERISRLFSGTLRWLPDRETWMVFVEGRWREDKGGGAYAAMRTIDQLRALEADCYDKTIGSGSGPEKAPTSEYEDFLSFVARQRFATKTEAAAKTLRYTGQLSAMSSSFDQHPMLLNAANGIIDLSNGNLLEHDPSYLLSHQTPVYYDPSARAPRWEQFLVESMPDPEMRNYLQRLVGYSITGSTSEQVMFLHYGPTKNGKSVFLDLMEAILGPYAQTVPTGVLTTTRNEQHSTGVARMEGRRLLQLSETKQGDRLDEQLVKRLSGGDTVSARGMRENDRDFKIVGKVHLATNHLPHINHDEATMRRLRLVHWSQVVPEERRDPWLAQRLRAEELPGILAWAVRGALEWQQHRLAPPFQAVADTEVYVAEEDEFGIWMDARTLPSTQMIAVDVLYRSYSNWAIAGNLKPMSIIAFGRELRKRGVKPSRTSTTRGWELGLKDPMAVGGHFN